jgi:hypothetical protein
MATKPRTIDEYLAGLSAENHRALQKVRRPSVRRHPRRRSPSAMECPRSA